MKSLALSMNSRLTGQSKTSGKKSVASRATALSNDPRLAKAQSKASSISNLSKQSKLSKLNAAAEAAKRLDLVFYYYYNLAIY